ncbi:MAG: hypothetical protein ACYC1C_11715 [Chloroflexota bacterium]
MDKNIGFNRNILLPWLDATAAFCAESTDVAEVRARLEPLVRQDIPSPTNSRKAIDILINIWMKSGGIASDLRSTAVALFQSSTVPTDRLWLHYGLTLLYYPFFRETTAAIGQLSRSEDVITGGMVKKRIIAERGQLGSLEKAAERIVFSLRNWGILSDGGRAHAYGIRRQALAGSSRDLEAWLLACALHAHPAEEVPFADLVRLPELFPFRFNLGLDDLRGHPEFAVERQGGGWDMVRLVEASDGKSGVG